MFCARCGQQIPEASVTCPLCGREATIQLPPQPMSSASGEAVFPNAPAPIFAGARTGRLRVGGWLLFFCISTAILTPLANLVTLVRTAEVGSPWALYYFGLMALSLVVGIAVWQVSPSAIQLVRAYLIALAMWELLRISYVVITAGSSMDLQMVLRIRTLVLVVLWAAYFQKSQRVRATFGRNLSGA